MSGWCPYVCVTLIEVFSFLVPNAKRAEWKDEWNAEIWYHWRQLLRRRFQGAAMAGLIVRCFGAFVHAVWLRKKEWRLEMLIQDLIYGVRTLLKRPGFATISIVVLALGIGANTAIFSVVYSVLLRPLPYKDPDRLVMVFSHNTRQDVAYSTISYDDAEDFRTQNEVFESLAPVTTRWAFSINLTGQAEPIFGTWVSSSFFDIVGVGPVMGRMFTSEEDRPGGPHAVILSHEMWQRRMGGDPSALGKTINLDGGPWQVIGIMAPGFRFLEDGEIWLPVAQNPVSARGRNVRFLNTVARLKPGVSMDQAQISMRTVASRLEKQYPDTNTGFTVDLRKLHEQVTGTARPALLVLLGAVGLVLLIACANVANLMLVRAGDRRREVAVRTALGADRSRLIKQFLTESVLLSVIGAAAGLALAEWGIRFLLSLAPNLPRVAEIKIDVSVLAFTFVLSITTGLLFGLVPAIRGTRSRLNDELKESGRGSSDGASHHRLRKTLVVSEIALALVLLIAAGLLIRSFERLINIDPGFRTDGLLLVVGSVPVPKYPQPQQRLALYFSLEDKLKSIPGVVSVGACSRLPLSGFIGTNNVTSFFTIEGRTVPTGERPEIDYRIASTDYFEAMGIPMIRGRKFTREDTTEVAIVNDAAARKFWPNQNPIGQRVNFGANLSQSPWVTIVGIVGNVRHLGLEVEPRAEIYRPYGNNPLSGPMIAIRTAGDPTSMAGVVRSEIRAIESDMPLTINTVDKLIELSTAQRCFSMLLLGIFAAIAMFLAVAGIYGVMSYTVSQRTHEIGLRMALGAQTRQVLRTVVGEGLVLTAIGIVIGVAVAMAVTRGMSQLLFGITSTDPLTYFLVSLELAAVALIACYIPARRAARVDPLVALRHE